MVELWWKFDAVLKANACILAYVDPITADSSSGIRRGGQPRLGSFKNCVVYRQQTVGPNVKMRRGKRVRNPIFDITMQVGVYVVESQGDMPADVKCDEIGKCVVYAVEHCEFNDWCANKAFLVYDKGLDSGPTGPYYDDALKCVREDIRFRFVVAECTVMEPVPTCF